MTPRKKTLFKVGNEIIAEALGEMYPNQIDEMKWTIAFECGLNILDITHEEVESLVDVSDEVDCSDIGLVFWRSLSFDPIVGLYADVDEDGLIDMMVQYQKNENVDELLTRVNFFIE